MFQSTFENPVATSVAKHLGARKRCLPWKKIEDVEFERKKKKVRSESFNKQRNKQRNKALTS